MMALASLSQVDKKLDLILERLNHIEELLSIEEDLPLSDEVHSIRSYVKKKESDKIKLIKAEDAFNDL